MYCGSQSFFNFVNPNRTALKKEHFYINDTFERIIIGQRLGDLMSSDSGKEVLTKPLISNFNQLIEKSECLTKSVKDHYLNKNILFYSKLREAPALGAGIDAYLTYKKNS